MWKLTLHEIKYNWGFATVLLFLTLGYTYFCLNNYQLLEGAAYEIDYWGGIFAFFLYVMFYAFWVQRKREQRIRTQTLLPVPQNTVSSARIFLIQGSALTLSIYLIVVHFLLIDRWHEETGSILMQMGLFYLSFQLFLIIRDRWFSSINMNFKILHAIAAVIILLAILYWFFISGRLLFYQILGWNLGRASLILIALAVSPILLYTFRKRFSYFS